MAISFGNTSEGGNNFSHNNNGNFLVVSVSSTTNDVTAVTYNSVSMTQIGTVLTNTSTARYISQWGLVAPASGSNTITITGGTNHDSQAISAIGVEQTIPYTNVTTNSGTSTTPAITLTTTETGSYIFGMDFQGGDVGTAGTNTTKLNTSMSNDYQGFYSSTNAVDSTSGTLNVTLGSSLEWDFKAFSLNPATLLTNLSSVYHLEDTSDSVGSFTLTNTGTTPFNPAKFNNGSDFGTANSTKDLKNSSLQGTTVNSDKSISFWAKINTTPSGADSYPAMVSFGYNSNKVAYNIGYVRDSGANKVQMSKERFGVGSSKVISAQTLGTSTYHHFVMTLGANTLTAYLDGSSLGTVAINTGDGSSGDYQDGIFIGRTPETTSPVYQDSIVDEVNFWTRELSASEVTQLYNSGNGLPYPFTSTTNTGDNFMMGANF